jgi:hypothetical protein
MFVVSYECDKLFHLFHTFSSLRFADERKACGFKRKGYSTAGRYCRSYFGIQKLQKGGRDSLLDAVYIFPDNACDNSIFDGNTF